MTISLRRAAIVVAVNVIVFGVLAESVALLAHFAKTGRLFYVDRPSYVSAGDALSGQLTADVLNPYFGPSHRAGIPFDVPPELRAPGSPAPKAATNNFGFVSPYSYPIDKGDREFIVGIFGGSVSVWFCQVGVERLLADLQQQEFFKSKTLVPLCMAHEGYKQPQQALVLAYFLSIGQTFDLVINIDGLNEVALSAVNNQQRLDISMPSASHLIPLINLIDKGSLTPARLESLSVIARYKERLDSVTGRLNRNRSAAVDAALGGYRTWLMNRYDRELRTLDSLPSAPPGQSLIGAIPPTEDRSGASLFEEIARNWAQASLLMRSMLAAQGVPYVHVLQPNQYHHTARSFTVEETTVALSKESAFKTGVEQGYPALLAEAAAQRLAGRAGFFDGTRIFDAEPAPVYIDNCCHYTRVGYLSLADFVARAIMTVPGPWHSPAVP
jgi:hypothetical protein